MQVTVMTDEEPWMLLKTIRAATGRGVRSTCNSGRIG
jgi:hypothetical protein